MTETGAAPETSGLKVPFGRRNDGRLIPPEQAQLGDDVRCPACAARLLVRGGDGTKVRRHFSHRSDVTCSLESMLHQTAKGLVAQVLRDSMTGAGPEVVVSGRCAECKTEWTRPFRPNADAVAIEHRLQCGRVADVAVLHGRHEVAAIEILVTHEVDDVKAKDLGSLPCAELVAEEVLADPLRWRPRSQRARPQKCAPCRALDEVYREAGVPRWVDGIATCGGSSRQVHRRGDLLLVVVSGELGVEAEFAVAKLNCPPSMLEWRDAKPSRARFVNAKRRKYPNLPPQVDVFWCVEAALQQFGGSCLVQNDATWRDVLESSRKVLRDAEQEGRWVRICRIAASTQQWLPPNQDSPYWLESTRCFASVCYEEMIVYSWRWHSWMTDVEPPAPRPTTVKFRSTAPAGLSYWANVCPACDRVQGENYVYEPRGPLPSRLAGRPPSRR